MKVEVWKKDERAKLPERSTEGSVGYDIFALEDLEILPGEFKLIRTGLVMKAPYPYALLIFPRSSLFKNKGLIFPNSAGIIDFDYCGADDEIKIPVVNITQKAAFIKAHEKIAQAIFIQVGFPEIVEIKEPPQKTSRGGFGSTGGYR
ncbi:MULTISPECIES: dUTP diphosphatase [Thermodesulfobacterium]|jgi:dUTP pyrophosphatase|uniref:dUTP diphosphatase n=2 Tax=Thermodesulfobacterium commune TaxID=1741 RepID=A0A075WRG6_9BACT|nr:MULTISPECIES: dUTP diphosphatase [Thermodesulfobacterium]KUJ98337.1 MAG: Deoxyuridine 5'-triphosphate nucleotidohydrolase Dut [Thermodesulfobacterium sp. 37_54]KUK19928.1 MAG: Deoxyuridine 5'-triphosphate nucleotidohydrolase Dut [Thermodesulfobacterium commune]AIH03904.1 deoxyuridine 5'-triphosphate nucleotidohydrolase [Thermodesulfobacterium commune DSM 2178]KUK37704.1 MAG: Deoxyuridine 5'-triphosphate nucleotidohydrolase Dut [Thermodesulfobacterium commune]MBZ4681776.1 deoxyuridine 5-trip